MMKRDRDRFDDRIQDARGKLADAERVVREVRESHAPAIHVDWRKSVQDAEAEARRARSNYMTILESAWQAVMASAVARR